MQYTKRRILFNTPDEKVTFILSGLKPMTTYELRLRAENRRPSSQGNNASEWVKVIRKTGIDIMDQHTVCGQLTQE